MSTTSFRGYPCCPCLAEWLPVYEAELIRRGVIVRALDVYQLTGNAPASQGTHKGGAFDTAQHSLEAISVARQMGADATWARTRAQGFSLPHAHGVLRGCPHNGAARYQIVAVDAGYNGLGRGGRSGADDGPRPLSGRTWREGIRWAREQAPKELPKRVVRTRDELDAQVRETSREIKRLKLARDVARSKGEDVRMYADAIAAMKRAREEQRRARKALGLVAKR